MIRVNNSVVTRRRRKKVLKQSRGFVGTKHRSFRSAKEQLMKSWSYSYAHRKSRPAQYRRQWILDISAAVRSFGVSYSRFIYLLKASPFSNINRKLLAAMVKDNNMTVFKLVCSQDKTNNVNE